MLEKNFYALDENERKMMLEVCLGKNGTVTNKNNGQCSEIYILDQGKHVIPRYICAKVPKLSNNCNEKEAGIRFIAELKKQLSFYHHNFVHWAFDFKVVMGAPVALFRYWGSDLDKLIKNSDASRIQKLSIMVYICSGLQHCYSNGLIAHQDLKPANIFLRDIRKDFSVLPNFDIYLFPLIADFGLANAFKDSNVFDGARPYMAPEQWNKSELSMKTDVFSLGVIFFELMTNGYHPAGIKIRNFWPQPAAGNSNKWTRPDNWRKWSFQEVKIDTNLLGSIDTISMTLIKEMLSTCPENRPQINDVLARILSLIKTESLDSYNQIHMLLTYFNNQVSTEPLEEQWPYLFDTWNKFKSKFEIDNEKINA